ncbi:PLDc N-terminal domain-containing protein [Microbacterium sp. G2-8]|uniref:PLDc N-terminal domain-containing protein n=1 Tax=Microbacterium sp. G2-8 TaxID=2842454 RepID=UPI001C8AB6EE|nr:PLDc N-terminal domain-containing protein [Microbacterium sp. G2-8]
MTRSTPRSVPAQILFGVLGVVQVAFTLFAFLDLAGRKDDEVRMSRSAWIPILLVNWVGPASYFAVGVKR